MADDGELARRAVSGDNAAFDTLVRRHQSAVRGFLRRLTRNDHALADDLAQEAFLTAFRKKHQFVDGSFLSWLYAISWSRFLMHARKRRNGGDTILGEEAAVVFTEGTTKLDLERALGQLASAESAAITLCLGIGYTHEEAAAILGLPLGTLKSHLFRGREKVKALLEGICGR